MVVKEQVEDLDKKFNFWCDYFVVTSDLQASTSCF